MEKRVSGSKVGYKKYRLIDLREKSASSKGGGDSVFPLARSRPAAIPYNSPQGMFSEDQRVKLLPFCMNKSKTKMLINLMFCTSGVPVVVFLLLAMLVVMWGGCIVY